MSKIKLANQQISKSVNNLSAAKPTTENRLLKTKQPQTMEELLASQNKTITPFVRGTKVKAKVLSISKHEIITDIGAKSYGIVLGREFEAVEHLLSTIKVGDTLDAEVIIPEMESGDTLISLKRTLSESLWTTLAEMKKRGDVIKVVGERVISGGLLVMYKSLRGFIPSQQLDSSHEHSLESLVGASLEVKILEVDQRQNRLVLSEKEVTQSESLGKLRKSLKNYKIGDTISAKVVGMDKYVVTVQTQDKKKEPVEGIIHISEVSWERIDKLTDVFDVGDVIKAKVNGIDDMDACLLLSIKQMTKDPWDDIDKHFAKDQQVKGKIARVTSVGVFVELEKGIEGLLHISKMPAGKEFKPGDSIQVTIDTLDKEKRKISLSVVETSKPIGYR